MSKTMSVRTSAAGRNEALHVAIVKPGLPHVAFGSERWDRGERVIMVNGERWGRTHVSHHGIHGTRHVFAQAGGKVLMKDPDKKDPQEYEVRCGGARRARIRGEVVKPTDELVREMAQNLVDMGVLRDPKVVREEQSETNKVWRASMDAAIAAEDAAFKTRASASIPVAVTTALHDSLTPTTASALSELLERNIIEAMRWAQTQ